MHYRGGPESSFVILTSYLPYLLNHIDSCRKLDKQYVLNLDQLIPQQIHSLGLFHKPEHQTAVLSSKQN